MKEKKKEKQKTSQLNFNKILVAFSITPMIVSVIVMLIMLLNTSCKEIEDITQDSMLSLVKETGAGFENYVENGENTLRSFAKSPLVVEFLQNQKDAALQKQA